jgi:branched-chain amino acid aminotransferase
VDGRLLAPHEATISALDAGFLLGDGLFESLRAGVGGAYLLDRHLARLYAGARELGFADMPAPEQLARQVAETLDRAGLQDAYLRITISRGRGAVPPAPPSGAATVVIAALPAPPRCDAGVGVAVSLIGPPAERGPKAKSTSRQAAVSALRRAQKAGAAEGIYVSADGRVLEGTAANVFVAHGGALLTPPREDCLPGITRGRLIELARGNGLEVREQPLAVEQLLGAQEALLTNAVQGLRAIASIDGHPIGAGRRDEAFDKGEMFDRERGVFAALLSLYKEDRAAAAAAAAAAASGHPR